MSPSATNTVVVQQLLEYGANPLMVHWNSETVLSTAGRLQDGWFLEQVIWSIDHTQAQKGLNLNWLDGNGYSVLHNLLIYRRDLHLVDAVLEAGADPELKDPTGHTPLHLALGAGSLHYEVENMVDFGVADYVVSLLSWKENMDLQQTDARGWTALHMAVAEADYKAVDYLLDFGACPSSSDLNGVSPLDLALRMKAADNMNFILGRLERAEVKNRKNPHDPSN